MGRYRARENLVVYRIPKASLQHSVTLLFETLLINEDCYCGHDSPIQI